MEQKKACTPSCVDPLVSPCTPLHGLCVFAVSKILSPVVSPCAPSYGWCVRFLRVLSPLVSFHVYGVSTFSRVLSLLGFSLGIALGFTFFIEFALSFRFFSKLCLGLRAFH